MIVRPANLISAIMALFAFLGIVPDGFAVDTRPNIVFLFCDDQRADTIAALGNSQIVTPNLDRLVKRGVSFHRAYMQGGLHGATCIPSRAMLLSGRPLWRIDESLMRDETWPASFGKSGYATFVTGKWHNGPNSIAKSFQTARGIFSGGMTNPMQAPLSDLVEGKLSPARIASKHACEVFADEAIDFISQHPANPFLCYVAFDGPHDPHIVPGDFPIHYDAAKVPLPPNYLPFHPWDNGEMTVRDELLLPWPRTREAVRMMNAEYYRYVSFLDVQIGRILDVVDALPKGRDTYIVFTADSGVARGSHGLIGKQNVYEHSVGVPLIISGPGIPADQQTDAMCYLFDVLPTLGQLCQIPAPVTSEGIEFTATLRNPSIPARNRLVFGYRDLQRAIRDERWKLIRYPHIDRTSLFDLKNDPDERVNLITQPEYAARAVELLTAMESELKSFGDKAELTVSNPRPAEWTPPVGELK